MDDAMIVWMLLNHQSPNHPITQSLDPQHFFHGLQISLLTGESNPDGFRLWADLIDQLERPVLGMQHRDKLGDHDVHEWDTTGETQCETVRRWDNLLDEGLGLLNQHLEGLFNLLIRELFIIVEI